ncbi:Uncharacterised protein [[Clostridium] sordellii]|nr:Uncharacterised protein [[Clostridium] sordellii] [Paeniclostridium sordellii]
MKNIIITNKNLILENNSIFSWDLNELNSVFKSKRVKHM